MLVSASAAAVGRLAHHVGAGVQVRTLHHERMQTEAALLERPSAPGESWGHITDPPTALLYEKYPPRLAPVLLCSPGRGGRAPGLESRKRRGNICSCAQGNRAQRTFDACQ